MIVRQAGDRLHLITQPDHAALARRVMEHWAPLQGAAHREAILLAIGEHDNGWQEPDAAPEVDPATGRVLDFITVPAATRQGVWPRGVARLAERNPWAAALVAHHAVFVYDRFRSDPQWRAFFTEMETTRDALVSRTGRRSIELEGDYRFLRLGDLISLVFCNPWSDAQVYEGWTIRLHNDRVEIAPDPFDGREIPMVIEAREVADAAYESGARLLAALRESPVVTVRGVAARVASGVRRYGAAG